MRLRLFREVYDDAFARGLDDSRMADAPFDLAPTCMTMDRYEDGPSCRQLWRFGEWLVWLLFVPSITL